MPRAVVFCLCRNLAVGLIVGVSVCYLAVRLPAAPPVDFVRDVQPILSEHCTLCHGADPDARQSGLRLDLRDEALRGGDSGEPAIVPGDVERGTLLQRISSTDDSERMPPLEAHNPLTTAQIETLKDWVAQGANYASHWAFVPPQKPEVDSTLADPIDALVARQWDAVGLRPTPPAPPAELCRRLYLDIIGLPPSIDELEAFERDGLEVTLEKLLSSERYGEKWARHWLDAARYSDTNGYEKDLRREQWIWRDWVIDALNRDMPYDQFIREQIAGDLMPDATQEQIVATGFLRNSMLNEEGAIVAEQFRMFEMFDRIDCIGKAVLGLTVQCAQCHSHKFDPLSHHEYYGLFAYVNDVHEAQSWIYDTEQLQKIDELKESWNEIDERIKRARPDWQSALNAFGEQIVDQSADWQPLNFHQLEAISGLNHPVQLADQSILMLGHTSGDIFYVGRGELAGVTGLRLEVLPHGDLPFTGPGRSSIGGWNVLELEVLLRRPGSSEWEKQTLVNASADFAEAEQKLDEGKKATGPIAFLIDGKDENSWRADRGLGRRNQASVAVVQFEKPLDCPPETEIKVVMRMGDMLGCCRVSTTQSPGPTALSIDYSAVLAAHTPTAQRTPQQQAALFAAWKKSVPELKSIVDEADALWSQFPQAKTSVLHLAKRSARQHRPTHLLVRGEWDQHAEEVEPHVPAAFHPLDPSLDNDRLAFANWLVDRRSPLAARVAVNRIWQTLFGEGLVETSEDFGYRAPVPEQLAVLDWLAVEFMEQGWSQKHLLATIVRSQTYQRDSAADAADFERDPKNRWLARGPRFRCDAEVIRDIALSVSGLITHRLGGPGVIPPVPQNVLDYNYTYPSYWIPATGPERYRRTVYGFRKRSMPDPVLASFDAPNGDFSCARRPRSNTPLAALTGLNEIIFVEAAQAFALRILRDGGSDDAARAQFAFRLCTARLPSEVETIEILNLLDSQRKRLAEGWLNPREIATGDPAKLPELPSGSNPQDAAAWTLVARVLLNLDETITKN